MDADEGAQRGSFHGFRESKGDMRYCFEKLIAGMARTSTLLLFMVSRVYQRDMNNCIPLPA
jgi:hypothetical protein